MSLRITDPQGEIGRADAGGLDLDPDLSLARFRQRDPGPLQHLGRSVPGHHNRIGHGQFLSGSGLGMAADGRFQRVRWTFFPAPSVVPGSGADAFPVPRAGQICRAVALPGPRPGADAAGQVRRHHPVQHGAAGRGGHRARRPGGLATPAVTAPVPRCARSRLRFVMSRLPVAGGHVPGPGGPVTVSSATYVICHVNVNMTCHVIIGRKGCPRARSPE